MSQTISTQRTDEPVARGRLWPKHAAKKRPKLKSMAIGKMGYLATEVGDLVWEAM